VVKFTSWFKGQSTNLSDEQKDKPLLPPGNEKEESTPSDPNPNGNGKKLPPRLEKAKQVFIKAGKVSSAVISKLPGMNKPLYRRIWILGTVGLGGSIAAVTYTIWSIDKGLPNKIEFNSIVREQTLTIKASDGSILRQEGPATREQLTLQEMPDNLKKAFIASEDRRFSKHNGVDFQGIGRAIVTNLRSQGFVEGGSSITQQLSRILFLNQERTFLRKLKEMRLAQKMERELGKDQILERYLNLVYLGSGAYGVADAAWVYFSKPVDKLTLAEMATIAGLAPAPSVYAPDRNPDIAKQRRNLVLQRMFEDGVITDAEKQTAVAEPLSVNATTPKRLQQEASYFTSYVQKELPKYVSPDAIAAGGLTVETTLNPKWQKEAEKAVTQVLKNEGRWDNFKQAAMVSIDPRTGEIKAMVGGRDFGKNQFNRVTQAQRQPGSTFKGIVYATGIATGMSPYTSFLDAPLIVDGYEPKNFDEGYRGWMTMRDALTKSINVVAVRILMKVGFNPIITLAKDMGIKSELKPTYSLALGSNEVNLLEMTSAYGTFAHKGLHSEAHGITRVINRRGEEIWKANFQPKQALDKDSSAIMTWMLQNVVNNGTGRPAQLGNRPVAGKTGTTDEVRDLWFIGFIPQLVTGVWLGNDDNKPTWGNSGIAAQTWNDFMEDAVKGMEVEKFPELPKLEGRKGTIKVESVKARRIINRPAPIKDTEDDNDNSNSETPRRRRSNNQESNFRSNDNNSNNDSDRPSRSRRRSYQSENNNNDSNEETPRRSRRRFVQQESSSNEETPRRTRRRAVQQESSSNEETPRRTRRRAVQQESSSNEETPRRTRRRAVQQESNSSNEETPRRTRRVRVQRSESSNYSNESPRPRRRRVEESSSNDSPPPRRSRRSYSSQSSGSSSGSSGSSRRRSTSSGSSGSSGSSSSSSSSSSESASPSWRERLRPSSSSSDGQ
jgi:penicillin-binding protein 1A